MARSPALAIVLGALVATGCGPAETTTSGMAPIERTETDQWGLITCSEATPDRTCYTHRSIMGVSMGASGAGQLGFERPDLFDGIGMLGIPMLDWTYMLRNFERAYLGGFCDRETILANLDRVNDPDGPAFCGARPGVVKLEPSGRMIEPEQDFNHWYRWIKAGRGGTFGRDKLRESFQDISLAFGNANYYNEASPYFPPGVPMDYRERRDPDRCATPVVIRGLKHKEYNPEGTYDTVVTCDSDKIPDKEGDFDPTRPNRFSFEMLLSVDYNGNGRRDYAEPVITMSRERWQDTGTRPNDAYDWDTNPSGTAGNWLYDEGEPFEDTGLDGVPGTGDYGEGNGKYDYSPNVLNYFAQNPRHLIRSMPDGHLDRLSIWADAGLRDFLASAAGSNWFWGELRHRLGGEKVRDYTTFRSLPGAERDYDFLKVDYSSAGLGQHAYVRYGDPDASQRDIDRGDGHHVGPADQLLDRFLTSLSFLQSRFYEPDIRAANEVGDPNELIEPQTYYSEALGEERPFGIVFPPGYFDPANAEKRYPVVYLLHGQGQESDDLLASAILFFGYMAASNDTLTQRKFQSDWAKFIMVFPDSRCRRGECDGGNFNANHPGMDGNGPRFKDAVFELMAHVEKNFRVRRPVEVPR